MRKTKPSSTDAIQTPATLICAAIPRLWWQLPFLVPNLEGKETQTPEQKALIEKNIFEEVSKIADEKVRAYYTQEMQKRIYENLGRGSLNLYPKKNAAPSSSKKNTKIKPPMADVDLRFILAAILLYT